MDKHIRKNHNVSCLLYHLVCPCKYRRKVLTKEVSATLKYICNEISKRHEINYIEIGTDDDHVHFLIQSVPTYSPKKIAQLTKTHTAKELFKTHPEIKKKLWGGHFWTSGYYINTVGQYGNEATIKNYVKNQGKDYEQLHRNQLTLTWGEPIEGG